MTHKSSSRIAIALYILNIICALLLAASITAPYINPVTAWPFAIAGLFFPVFLLLNVLFLILWLFTRRKWAILPLAICIAAIPAINKSFAFHSAKTFDFAKKPAHLRVLTWNVGLMNYTAPDTSTAINNNRIIFDRILESRADIVCLQEFLTSVIPASPYNFIDSIKHSLGYPYHYFAYDYPKFDGAFFIGSIIFSKLPIIDSSKYAFPEPFGGSMIRTGIVFNKDSIDIFTSRFQSVHFQAAEYKTIRDIRHGEDSLLRGTATILRKLKSGYTQRNDQLIIATDAIRNSKRPLIFTGDLNDSPTGYAYAQLKNGLNDAWLKKGSGIGRTFRFIAPTLRIDQVFYSSFFDVVQADRILSTASDHNGVLVDLSLKR